MIPTDEDAIPTRDLTLLMAEVEGNAMIREVARLVVRGPSGKKESQVDVRGSHSFRTIWKNGRALQIAFDNTNEFSHIDCKACASNPWWSRDGSDPTSQYSIELIGSNLWKIRCKKCGWIYDSG